MIRIAVCEDNFFELQMQKNMIQRIMTGLSKNIKIFCFQSGEDLLFEIDTTGNMDIIFLDVEMPGINGIKTGRLIRKRDTRVNLIFISCHNQYFKEMIEVQPYAFIDKPIEEEKLEHILSTIVSTRLNICDVYSFSYHKKQFTIPVTQIRSFKSDKRVIWVDTIDKNPLITKYMFYGKLGEVEKRVSETNTKFLRIRKSFLVNSQYIMEYSADKVVLDNGVMIEISQNYKESIRQGYISLLRGKIWE